jgi:hypothetical protein
VNAANEPWMPQREETEMKEHYEPSIIVRLKFQKRSALKFVSRPIPHSGGYNTPQLAAELFPKLALGFIPVICAVLLLGAVLVSPAFADMKKVDETELARANASVTGAPIKEPVASVDKNTVLQETLVTFDKRDAVFSPSVNKEINSVNLNINGQETFNFYFGPSNMSITGGITSVKPR